MPSAPSAVLRRRCSGMRSTPDDQRRQARDARPHRRTPCGGDHNARGARSGAGLARSVTIRPVDGPSNGTVPSVLVVCAGQRDRLNLADERILDRFALRFAGQPIGPGFDARTFVDHMARFGPAADGILGSSDATGHLATILADAAGLPGPGRAAFMRCHDKLACRRIQAEVVPEATPAFAPVDLDDPGAAPPLPFPFFLKPVAAHLSQLAFTGRRTRPSSPPRWPGRGSRSTPSPRTTARSRGATFRDADRRGAARRDAGHVRGLDAGRADDADRRHRRGHAPERHQLPALRVSEPPARGAAAGDGGRGGPADAGARVRPEPLQHRVLRAPGRARHDRRGERADGVAVRAARAGGARRVELRDPARPVHRRARRSSRRPATTW